jgi:hypothetical protein
MTTIKFIVDFTPEEAENCIDYLLTYVGWSGFTDKVFIGSKKVFDIENKTDQKWLMDRINMRAERLKKYRNNKNL